MANYQQDTVWGLVDKRHNALVETSSPLSATFNTNTEDVYTMRARLTAINAAYFTATQLDKMTRNDMLYAIRLNDEAASI